LIPVNESGRDSTITSISLPSLAVVWVGFIFLVVGLILGTRDAWVSARGAKGRVAVGLAIELFTLIPVASVILCVAASPRQGRDRSSTLLHAGIAALVVGLPAALLLAVGATH
jgi:hypothetical protein